MIKAKECCSFCKEMDTYERKRYYPMTFKWVCPETGLTRVIEWSDTTNAKREFRNGILDKIVDGVFGKEVQDAFIEGTRNLLKE